MTTHELLAVRERVQIQQEIQHYTRPLMRMAIIVVSLIIFTVSVMRAIHIQCKETEVRHVVDPR